MMRINAVACPRVHKKTPIRDLIQNMDKAARGDGVKEPPVG